MQRKLVLIATILAFALVATACGSSSDDTTEAGGGDSSSGTILISGSSTVEPISARVAEEFSNANSGVGITVDPDVVGDPDAILPHLHAATTELVTLVR